MEEYSFKFGSNLSVAGLPYRKPAVYRLFRRVCLVQGPDWCVICVVCVCGRGVGRLPCNFHYIRAMADENVNGGEANENGSVPEVELIIKVGRNASVFSGKLEKINIY